MSNVMSLGKLVATAVTIGGAAAFEVGAKKFYSAKPDELRHIDLSGYIPLGQHITVGEHSGCFVGARGNSSFVPRVRNGYRTFSTPRLDVAIDYANQGAFIKDVLSNCGVIEPRRSSVTFFTTEKPVGKDVFITPDKDVTGITFGEQISMDMEGLSAVTVPLTDENNPGLYKRRAALDIAQKTSKALEIVHTES